MNETPAEEAERVASELAYTREAQRRRHDALVAQMQREEREAERYHNQEPGRWGDHASPARMRRDIERDREEERYR